ncbi:MAG: hypothetical protein K6T75_00435 [Acetobacteraceae bacterium]|nr:hypothetical protein [Acetobacteraceae bacterium]
MAAMLVLPVSIIVLAHVDESWEWARDARTGEPRRHLRIFCGDGATEEWKSWLDGAMTNWEDAGVGWTFEVVDEKQDSEITLSVGDVDEPDTLEEWAQCAISRGEMAVLTPRPCGASGATTRAARWRRPGASWPRRGGGTSPSPCRRLPGTDGDGCAFVVSLCWLPLHVQQRILEKLLNPTISVSAILVGFMATPQTVLVSMEMRNTIREVRRVEVNASSTYYDLLVEYVAFGSRAPFFLALYSGLLLLVNPGGGGCWIRCVVAAWVALVVVSLAAVYRVIGILTKIMRLS